MKRGLDLLKNNHAGAMRLKDGSTANYGVIRISDEKLLYYTEKALKEIWSSNLSADEKEKTSSLKNIKEEDEENLKASGYIDEINLDDIDGVIF